MSEKETPKLDGAMPIENILIPIDREEERRILDGKAQEFDKKIKDLFKKIGIK